MTNDPVTTLHAFLEARRREPSRGIRPLLRRVRRALHARVAHRRDRRADRRVRGREGGPGVPGGVRAPAALVRGPAVAHHRGRPVRRARRRRARLPQARGPQPHRLAQDQQRARPGAAHPATRQDPRHRRDRRRPARRRDRHRRGAVRVRVHDLHGRGRHRAPGAQRRADAPARRRGRSRSRPAPARSRTRSTTPTATGSRASRTTNYIFGTAAGPHPFPAMVRDFQKVISEEARAQLLDEAGRLPDAVIACVGGGSNAIGMFDAFLDDEGVKLYGVEAAGDGVDTPRHAASIERGRPGVLHGAKTYVLQDEDGQTIESHSISAGLDYPGVGPGALVARVDRARRVHPRDRRRGHAGAAAAVRDRGHHPRDRVRARPRRRPADRARARPRRDPRGLPLRSRRQGHGHRRPLLRPLRRGGPEPSTPRRRRGQGRGHEL